jgi:hypothetical protein
MADQYDVIVVGPSPESSLFMIRFSQCFESRY